MTASVAFVIAVVACGLVDVNSQGVESSLYSIGARHLEDHERLLYTVHLRLSDHRGWGSISKVCSGVRLSSDWILTCAKCFDHYYNYKYLDITLPEKNGTRKIRHELKAGRNTIQKGLKVILYGNYNKKSTQSYNLALIQSNLTTVSKVTKAPLLPSYKDKTRNYLGKISIMASYENVPRNGNVRGELHMAGVVLTIVSTSECKKIIPSLSSADAYFCASLPPDAELTKDDIGAPMMILLERNGDNRVIGVLSVVGPKSPKTSQRVLFTNIIPKLKWVTSFTHLPTQMDD